MPNIDQKLQLFAWRILNSEQINCYLEYQKHTAKKLQIEYSSTRFELRIDQRSRKHKRKYHKLNDTEDRKCIF